MQRGETPLYKAVGEGFEEVVKILLEHGSDVNIQAEVLIYFSFDNILIIVNDFVLFFFLTKHFFLCSSLDILLFSSLLPKVSKKL